MVFFYIPILLTIRKNYIIKLYIIINITYEMLPDIEAGGGNGADSVSFKHKNGE